MVVRVLADLPGEGAAQVLGADELHPLGDRLRVVVADEGPGQRVVKPGLARGTPVARVPEQADARRRDDLRDVDEIVVGRRDGQIPLELVRVEAGVVERL